MFIASGQQVSMTQHFCMHEVPKIATLIRMTVVCGSEKKTGLYIVQLNNLLFQSFREHKRSEINEDQAFKKRLC